MLEVKGQIKAKRDRVYTMEIDLIKPKCEYSKDNVILACYWCNNAKSDEFPELEFFNKRGPGIGKVWNSKKEKSVNILVTLSHNKSIHITISKIL